MKLIGPNVFLFSPTTPGPELISLNLILSSCGPSSCFLSSRRRFEVRDEIWVPHIKAPPLLLLCPVYDLALSAGVLTRGGCKALFTCMHS